MINEKAVVFLSKIGAQKDDLPNYIIEDIEKINNDALKEQKYSAYRLLNKGLVLLGYDGGLSQKILKKRQDGKPYFDDLHVSLTHTKGLVSVCFYKNSVGIDVERIKRFEKFKFPMLMGLDYHLPKETYCKEWTKKEASFKVDGGAVFSPIKINCENFYTNTIKVINNGEGYFLTLSSANKYDVEYVVIDGDKTVNYLDVEEIIL